MSKTDKIFTFSLIGLVICFGIAAIMIYQAEATGGGADIAKLINPIIDRAIQALQGNNTDLALEELETIKNELADTYETDEDEDN